MDVDDWHSCGEVELKAEVKAESFLESGWFVTEGFKLPTFTTSRPRDQPGFRPAGLDPCVPHERQRWEEDQFRFPPYQYRDHNLLWTKKGAVRRPNVQEREAMMCIPVGYTRPCLPKADQRGAACVGGHQVDIDWQLLARRSHRVVVGAATGAVGFLSSTIPSRDG